MPEYVAILEDSAARISMMRERLAELLPRHEHVFFDNASDMVAWLRDHLADVALISLDHDLPLHATRDGAEIDCGNGRIVADFLATLPPTCPLIVHSSNDNFATGMVRVLRDAGWPLRRVYPYDGTAWGNKAWMDELRSFIRNGYLNC
jgi:hypothetical protein